MMMINVSLEKHEFLVDEYYVENANGERWSETEKAFVLSGCVWSSYGWNKARAMVKCILKRYSTYSTTFYIPEDDILCPWSIEEILKRLEYRLKGEGKVKYIDDQVFVMSSATLSIEDLLDIVQIDFPHVNNLELSENPSEYRFYLSECHV